MSTKTRGRSVYVDKGAVYDSVTNAYLGTASCELEEASEEAGHEGHVRAEEDDGLWVPVMQ